MIKGIVTNGVIVPSDGLPDDWRDGTEVELTKIADTPPESPEAIDRWFAEMEAAAAQCDPEDDGRLAEAIREMHEYEKEFARYWMERKRKAE